MLRTTLATLPALTLSLTLLVACSGAPRDEAGPRSRAQPATSDADAKKAAAKDESGAAAKPPEPSARIYSTLVAPGHRIGQPSGGGEGKSTSYRVQVTVGGPTPLGTGQSTSYRVNRVVTGAPVGSP